MYVLVPIFITVGRIQFTTVGIHVCCLLVFVLFGDFSFSLDNISMYSDAMASCGVPFFQ